MIFIFNLICFFSGYIEKKSIMVVFSLHNLNCMKFTDKHNGIYDSINVRVCVCVYVLWHSVYHLSGWLWEPAPPSFARQKHTDTATIETGAINILKSAVLLKWIVCVSAYLWQFTLHVHTHTHTRSRYTRINCILWKGNTVERTSPSMVKRIEK